jgi:Pectate lyase superfamily protein
MVNVGGRIRAASLFLLMMLAFAPRVFAQNLSNYNGVVSITGNQTGGADSISHVNWDNVVDPRTYGAKCDGSTDDTSAFNSAIGSNRAVEIPQGSVCVIAGSLTISNTGGVTIFGQGRKEVGPNDTSPKTCLKFTGRPGTCSGGIGGLLKISSFSAAVTLRDMDIWFDTAGIPSNCGIYIYNSNRITLERLHIANPGATGGTAVNTTAIQVERMDESKFDNLVIDQGFGRAIYYPANSGNFLNRDVFTSIRIGPQPLLYEYLPLMDFEGGGGGSGGGTPQDIYIYNDTFEQAPQALKFANGGLGVEISTNYIADSYGISGTWQSSHSYAAPSSGGCIYASVSGTNYEFCNKAACTSGTTTPSWATTCATPGQVCSGDGRSSPCSWVNEGIGIGVELNMSGGSFHDNLVAPGTLVTTRLDVGSSAINVFGNYFNYGLRDELEVYGNAEKIGTNYFTATGSWPVQTTMLRVGDGTDNSYGNEVDAQYFHDTSTNSEPFLTLSANSSGKAMYDTSIFSSSRISNLSNGRWNITDPVGQVTVSQLSPPKLPSAPASAVGAGLCRVFAIAGTNTGTCKLQAICGTSATPTTVLDNIGAGC